MIHTVRLLRTWALPVRGMVELGISLRLAKYCWMVISTSFVLIGGTQSSVLLLFFFLLFFYLVE